MQYLGLAIVVGLLAVLVFGVALRVLLGGAWFMGFVRGVLGLAIVGLGAGVALVAYDLSSYRDLPESGQPLATLTFRQQSPGLYEVTVELGETRQQVLIEGERWQVHLSALDWHGLPALIGLQPGYRLERLEGRYLALEQQDLSRFATARLVTFALRFDPWRNGPPGLNAIALQPQRLRTDSMPLADGARYRIDGTPGGLQVEPVNELARQAAARW